MKTTAEVLAEMFTESTGRHMLDSGGAYGRSWERNQTAVEKSEQTAAEYFMSRPDVKFHGYDGELDYMTINTFKWLEQNLDFDAELQARYDEFVADSENPHLVDMEDFVESLMDATETRVVNTYNYETILDETLQWVEYRDGYGDTIVLLQYHGGCDVRGGYTAPRVFRSTAEYFGDDRAELWCTNNDTATTLDGEDVQMCQMSAMVSGSYIEWYDHSNGTSPEFEGTLKVNEDGQGLCPRCGDPLEGEIASY